MTNPEAPSSSDRDAVVEAVYANMAPAEMVVGDADALQTLLDEVRTMDAHEWSNSLVCVRNRLRHLADAVTTAQAVKVAADGAPPLSPEGLITASQKTVGEWIETSYREGWFNCCDTMGHSIEADWLASTAKVMAESRLPYFARPAASVEAGPSRGAVAPLPEAPSDREAVAKAYISHFAGCSAADARPGPHDLLAADAVLAVLAARGRLVDDDYIARNRARLIANGAEFGSDADMRPDEPFPSQPFWPASWSDETRTQCERVWQEMNGNWNRTQDTAQRLHKALTERTAERDAAIASCADVQDMYLKAIARAEAAEKDLAESRSRESALDEACDTMQAKLAAANAALMEIRDHAEGRMHGSHQIASAALRAPDATPGGSGEGK